MQGNTFFGFSGGGGSTPPPVSNSWLLNGNTEGAEKYFGTNDNFSIPIYTNGSAIGIFLNTGDFGFGTIAPTSRVHIKGLDSTSSNYALKVDNSASSPLLYVRNDGIVSIGKTLQIQRYNYSSTKAFWMEANSIEDTEMNTLNADLIFKTKYSGGSNVESIRFTKEGIIKVADTNYISIGAYNVTTDKYGYLSSASNTTSGVGLKFEVCQPANTTGFIAMQIENTGNVGIGTTPTARLHVEGIDSTSLNYALKIDNSASSPLLYVNNEGNIGIGIAPTLADVKLEVKVATNQRFIFRNFTYPSIGAALTLQAINDATTDVVNVVTLGLDWYHASRNNLFSNPANTIIPTAKVHIIGNNQGSDLFALKVDDVLLSPLLYVRNDGAIGVNVSSPLARFHNFGLNNSINLRLEPVADVTEDTTGGTVQTIDNTSNVTAQTISIPTDKVVSIESTIVYRKTAGAGIGTVGDGTTFKLNSSVKNVGGTLTLDTVQNTYTGTTNAIIGCSATYTISGTNVLVSVTGVVNDTITWNIITKVNTVS